MSKISRAQETQDVTMGNPSKGKTHQEKSFLYNEEYKYKRDIELSFTLIFLQPSMLNQHLLTKSPIKSICPCHSGHTR